LVADMTDTDMPEFFDATPPVVLPGPSKVIIPAESPLNDAGESASGSSVDVRRRYSMIRKLSTGTAKTCWTHAGESASGWNVLDNRKQCPRPDADDDEDVHSAVPRFECGRLVHANYVRLSDVPSLPFPKCSQLVKRTGDQAAFNNVPTPKRPSTAPDLTDIIRMQYEAGLTERGDKLPFSSLLTLEICAGSAGLTAALRRVGFDALGVDHKGNKHFPKAPTAKIDISSAEGQRIIREVLDSKRLFYCHMHHLAGRQARPEIGR
jgi:hypothetical protein